VVTDHEPIGLPFELPRTLAAVDRAGRRWWPTLFAYQFLYEAAPTPATAG